MIGRGPKSLAALPERLASTEAMVNHIFRLTTGRSWDVMMAARSFSRRAAQAVVEGSTVDTIGNDVAWPLLCRAQGALGRVHGGRGHDLPHQRRLRL